MKILDPQSALLTTAEVYQFLKDNPLRKADKKVGSYPIANLNNYEIVRSDLENYATINIPHVTRFVHSEKFMQDLITRLRPYELTKAEVFTLINLGISSQPLKPQTNGEKKDESNEKDEETPDSDLSKTLFRLVVEESEQRFEGDDGERKIDEILNIFDECISTASERGDGHANGH